MTSGGDLPPLPTPDWYAVLGVVANATRAEIASAFRVAMKACHPDLFPGDPIKEARARALSSAKSVLCDEQRRAAYDAARARSAAKPASKAASKPAKKPAATATRATKATRTAKMPARPAKPSRRSRLAVEYLGQRQYAGRSWQQTVTRMHRQAVQARNPGKKFMLMRIVECTVKAPGLVELRFAYGRGSRRVVMAPTVARLYWAA